MRLTMKENPRSLDPRRGGDRRSQNLINMLFEGLTRIGLDGRPAPAAAEEIFLSDDQKMYTFKLREEGRWSDGTPVTAHDFEYAWKSILSPTSEFLFGEILYPIRNAKEAKQGKLPVDEIGVKAIDSHTLVVNLAHPAPYFLTLIANGLFSPVPHLVDQKCPNWHCQAGTFVSNGTFHLAEYKFNDSLTLNKSDTYWDRDAVALPSIHISIVPDGESAFALFEQGELDWMGEPFTELSLEVTPKLREQGILETKPILAVFRYVFNAHMPPFQSEKMRQAFSYALDREAICTQLLKMAGEPVGSLLPPTVSLHDKPLHSDLQLDKARKLFTEALDEMGITKEELSPIVISYGMIEGHKAISQAAQQQWTDAFDLPIQIEGYDWSTYVADHTNRKYQVSGLVWFSVHDDPIFNLNCFREAHDRLNPSNWENSEFQRLLTAADHELDPGKRRSYLADAESVIMREAPITPIFASHYRYVKSKRVKGVFIKKTGHVDFKWASLD